MDGESVGGGFEFQSLLVRAAPRSADGESLDDSDGSGAGDRGASDLGPAGQSDDDPSHTSDGYRGRLAGSEQSGGEQGVSEASRLSLAIDLRLTDLWAVLDRLQLGQGLAVHAAAVRVAYARGYRDGDAYLFHFLKSALGLIDPLTPPPPAPEDCFDVELRLGDVYQSVSDCLTLQATEGARLSSMLCVAYSRGFGDGAGEDPFGPAPEVDAALSLPDAA